MIKLFKENNISEKLPSTMFGRETKATLYDNVLNKCEFPNKLKLDMCVFRKDFNAQKVLVSLMKRFLKSAK